MAQIGVVVSRRVRISQTQYDVLLGMSSGAVLTTTYGKKKSCRLTKDGVAKAMRMETVYGLLDRGMICKQKDETVNYEVVRTWRITPRGSQWVAKKLAQRGD